MTSRWHDGSFSSTSSSPATYRLVRCTAYCHPKTLLIHDALQSSPARPAVNSVDELLQLAAAGLLAQPAAPALTAQPHAPPPTSCAVCQPLRKAAVHRQAAADPPAPLPPPPAGSGHDGVPPQAQRGKRGFLPWPRVPAVKLQPWKQNFLVCCGIVLLGAAENIWTGPPIAIVAGVMSVIAVLLLLALL